MKSHAHVAKTSVFQLILARVSIALILMGAVICVAAIVRGHLPPEHIRWVLTAFIGAFFLKMTGTCTIAWNFRRSWIARLGQASSLLGFGLFLYGVWFDGANSIEYFQALFSLILFSMSAAHTSWALVRRLPKPLEILRLFSILCGWFFTMSLAVMLVKMIDNPEWVRFAFGAGLAALSSSFVLSIIHRLESQPVGSAPSDDVSE